jgi:alpha-galactosidase
MTNTAKIVFIGAGSAAFGISLFQDIFSSRLLPGSTLSLVDTNEESLDRMYRLATLLNKTTDGHVTIEKTTDRRAALAGADFVVNSVAIDRNRLWRLDFEIPKKHGIRHSLGENGGPGGLFFTMRTLPLIFDIARDVEEICPGALFINFSNPESRIILGLGKYTKLRVCGLCHGIFMSRWAISEIIGKAEEDIDCWGAGLNHFQWILHLRDRETGQDLYPLLREKEKTHDPVFQPLTRRMFHSFGRWITCSDDHMGEYVPFGWEGGEHGYDFDQDDKNRLFLKGWLEEVIAGREPIPQNWLTRSSGERAVAVIAGVLHNQKKLIESSIVYNQGAIPNLPSDLAVEVPVVADAVGLHPVSLGPLPEPMAKMLSLQAGVQQLAVEAAVHASRELALQALLIDPVMSSSDAALKILDELWEINRPYIRACV